MTLNGWLQILSFLLAVFLVTPPLGSFMARVFTRQRTWLDPVMRPLERLIYRLTRVNEEHEMRWTEYAVAVLLFSLVSMLVLYFMQRLQASLPFNPQGFGGVAPDLAFNTAASFTTNVASPRRCGLCTPGMQQPDGIGSSGRSRPTGSAA